MIRFEWDPAKARSNRRKHGIDFAVAQHVFCDSDALSEQDRIENGEHRWRTLGLVDGVPVLLVAHTADYDGQTEIVRVLPARSADGKEGKRYEKERQERNG